MPKLLIFDAFTLLIRKKNVANYALLRCKPFSLKIWLCQFLTNIMFAYFVQISYSIYMQVYFIFLLLWVIFVVYVGCWCCLRWRRHWWKICCDCIARGHFGVWWHHYVGTICIMSALSPTFPQQKIDIFQTEIFTIFRAGRLGGLKEIWELGLWRRRRDEEPWNHFRIEARWDQLNGLPLVLVKEEFWCIRYIWFSFHFIYHFQSGWEGPIEGSTTCACWA